MHHKQDRRDRRRDRRRAEVEGRLVQHPRKAGGHGPEEEGSVTLI
jgi:hypothetical protein